jgi:hypothetical protein
VLMIGCERLDEFRDAMRLWRRGHSVIVVNPWESAAARRFVNAGGTFIRIKIERLPMTFGPFDVICESYPYTVVPVEGVCRGVPCPLWISARAIRAYAAPRLRHLAVNGRWIIFTESPGFACALRAIVSRGKSIARNFIARVVPLTTDEAPWSAYPHLNTRFRVVFQRRPAEWCRASRADTKTAPL